jgi:hypothetical protein
MHAIRAAALLDAVQALLPSRRLILIELARAWPAPSECDRRANAWIAYYVIFISRTRSVVCGD